MRRAARARNVVASEWSWRWCRGLPILALFLLSTTTCLGAPTAPPAPTDRATGGDDRACPDQAQCAAASAAVAAVPAAPLGAASPPRPTSLVELTAEERLWLLQRRTSEAMRAKLSVLQAECKALGPVAAVFTEQADEAEDAAASAPAKHPDSDVGADTLRARRRLRELAAYAGVDVNFDSPCEVIVYQDDHFQGWSHAFGPGEHPLDTWPKHAKGDDISSMRVRGHCTVTLFQGRRLGGKWRAAFEPGAYTLPALVAGGAKNDRTNSLRVEPSAEATKWQHLAATVLQGIDSLLSRLAPAPRGLGTGGQRAGASVGNAGSKDEKQKKQQEQQQQAGGGEDSRPDCTQFLSCADCLEEGCGWCISDRMCVPDEPWICLGEHDHVGKFSDRLVKTCPAAEEAKAASQPLLGAEAEGAGPRRDGGVGAGAGTGAGVATDGPAARLTNRVNLVCLGWRQTAGCDPNGAREPQHDRSCDVVVPAGVSGYCACASRADLDSAGVAMGRSDSDSDGGPGTDAAAALVVRTALGDCSEDREPWTCAAKCATLRDEEEIYQDLRRQETAQRRAEELERVRGAAGAAPAPAIPASDAKCAEIREFMDSIRERQPESRDRQDSRASGSGDASGANADTQSSAEDNAAQLGAEFPYEVLEVEFSAAPSTIRKAYRRRSLWLHPDKAPDSCKALAANAFSALVAAYEVLGNPDTREMFDDFGEVEQEQFFSRWEWEKYASNKQAKDFYTRDPLVTNLRESSWERRVGGEESAIWLVEFYAPWCKACQDFTSQFKGLAKELSDDAVEACRDWFAVPSYPTLRLINRHHGMQQDYAKPNPNKPLSSDGVASWVRRIAAEWRVLFARSNVTELTPETFNGTLFGDDATAAADPDANASWFVLFTDGTACGPCRTAKTNLMRLGAAAAGLSLRVAFVDCQRHRRFCKVEHGAPQAPHAPFIKAWPRTPAQRRGSRNGVLLYNVNSVESHVAIEIVSKVVRLMATDEEVDRVAAEGLLATTDAEDGVTNFAGDDKKRNQGGGGSGAGQPPPFDGAFNWNGPRSRMAVKQVGGRGGGGSRRRMLGGS